MTPDARERRDARRTHRGWTTRVVALACVAVALSPTIARGAAVGFSVDKVTLLDDWFERDGGFFSLAGREDAFVDATKHNPLVFM